jgi:hypothetical protein
MKKLILLMICLAIPVQAMEQQLASLRSHLEAAISQVEEEKAPRQPYSLSVSNLHGINFKKLFVASEELLDSTKPLSIEKHPLYPLVHNLKGEQSITFTLPSGPGILELTDILLDKTGLDLTSYDFKQTPNLKIFENAETFIRCLNIFQRTYEEQTGKHLAINLSYALRHTPLATYLAAYISQYPEILLMDETQKESIARLLSVFNIGNDIVDLNLSLAISPSEEVSEYRSFKPFGLEFGSMQTTAGNEISLGQQNLAKQIQNLNGSELSMAYIKDVDGKEQFESLRSQGPYGTMNLLEIGGGRGETHAVPAALHEAGLEIRLLNAEPHGPFAWHYIKAHQAIGVPDVTVIEKKAQELGTLDVLEHYEGQFADAIMASHSFYFILGDMHKATQELVYGDMNSITQHPLWKYFEMLNPDGGKLVVTLQTGAGARLFRNALLGNHGLSPIAGEKADDTTRLLNSFGNMGTFLREFEFFAKKYEEKTRRKLKVTMRLSVANVPLGGFEIIQNEATGGLLIHNPHGADADASWVAPKMLDFYGNWKELQEAANQSFEGKELSEAEQEQLIKKQAAAIKSQKIFMHILPVFAPGYKNMQHPNITLEITEVLDTQGKK